MIHCRGKAGDVASSALQACGRTRGERENWDEKGKNKTNFLYMEINSSTLAKSATTV